MHRTMKRNIFIAGLEVALVVLIAMMVGIIPGLTTVVSADHYMATTHHKDKWFTWSPLLPFDKTYTAKDLLSDKMNQDILVVTALDAQNQTYKSYVRGAADKYNFEIEAGYSYWLWINYQDPVTYDENGTPIYEYALSWGPNHCGNISVPLYNGWNMVGRGGPTTESPYGGSLPTFSTLSAWEFMHDQVKYCTPVVISHLDVVSSVWSSYTYSGSGIGFNIVAFEGYYLWVNGNGTLVCNGDGLSFSPIPLPPIEIPEEPTYNVTPIIPPDYPVHTYALNPDVISGVGPKIVEGYTLDAIGTPIPDVYVSVTIGSTTLAAVSESDGYYMVTFSPFDWEVGDKIEAGAFIGGEMCYESTTATSQPIDTIILHGSVAIPEFGPDNTYFYIVGILVVAIALIIMWRVQRL